MDYCYSHKSPLLMLVFYFSDLQKSELCAHKLNVKVNPT